MKLDAKVAEAIMRGMQSQARFDLRWRIWEEVRCLYPKLIADKPRWWRNLSIATAVITLTGTWQPPTWSERR